MPSISKDMRKRDSARVRVYPDGEKVLSGADTQMIWCPQEQIQQWRVQKQNLENRELVQTAILPKQSRSLREGVQGKHASILSGSTGEDVNGTIIEEHNGQKTCSRSNMGPKQLCDIWG